MLKMFWKCYLFSLIMITLCAGILVLSARDPFRPIIAAVTDSRDFMEESGMLPGFERARQRDGTTQLVTGDSICRQMLAPLEKYNPEKSVLATNAALMMPGQYLLAREYLQNHPGTTDVFLIMHPLTLTRTFDLEWGYRYAAMTYVETDTFPYLEERTRKAMEGAYGAFFLNKDVVWMIENSPVCRKIGLSYMNTHGKVYEQSHPFEIADLYVEKLYKLCLENGVSLHLYSSPVAEYYREEMTALAGDYEQTEMSGLFPDYMKDIWYYPDEWTEDLSHFSGEYAGREQLNEILEQAYGQTPLWEGLRVTDPCAR